MQAQYPSNLHTFHLPLLTHVDLYCVGFQLTPKFPCLCKFFFFKLVSHQQAQQSSVTFMLPLNYKSVFEHGNSHTPKINYAEKGVVVRQIHITVSQERGVCMEVGSCRAHRQRRALFVYHLPAFGSSFLKKFTFAI